MTDQRKIRTDLVRGARERIADGTYDDPAILHATISKMLEGFKGDDQEESEGGS